MYGQRLLAILLLVAILATGCAPQVPKEAEFRNNDKALRLIASTHVEFLKPAIEEFNKKENAQVQIKTYGAVDLMLQLQQKGDQFDAILADDTLWKALGDTNRITRNSMSIMRSPNVLGVKMSKAQSLGWISKEVSYKDILDAVRAKQLSFAMPSPSQSTPGTAIFLGAANALKSSPGETLTRQDLQDKDLQERLRDLLSAITRTSADAADLKNNFVANPNMADAMFNYEAYIIQANSELTKKGSEPLYVVYPVDGLVISDSPLAYVDQGSSTKRELFQKLQTFLLTKEDLIRQNGWRTGDNGVGIGFGKADQQTIQTVFNPAWGIKENPTSRSLAYPVAEVLSEAINLYQGGNLRLGSATIFVIDTSGSMNDASGIRDANGREFNRMDAIKVAMSWVLDPVKAAQVRLQSGPNDTNTVIPFSDGIRGGWQYDRFTNQGSDTSKLNSEVQRLSYGGGTNLYDPTIEAIKILDRPEFTDKRKQIVVLTDGDSTDLYSKLEQAYKSSTSKVPIHTIQFGGSGRAQLERVSRLSGGIFFDGRDDPGQTFRRIRAEN